MQWDKVKNILIAILLTINLFLLGNLAVRGWQSHRRTSELEANLRTLVSARGMQLDTAFSFPEDITLPELSLDRSRADEEKDQKENDLFLAAPFRGGGDGVFAFLRGG